MKIFQASELILNNQNRVYHLDLSGSEVADNVILVGDQERVSRISSRFSRVDIKRANREFISHTGWYQGKRMTVLSTGIGCDNLDIVMNELDAAVNIDLDRKREKDEKRHLRILRLGTCGALQEELSLDTVIAASHAIGLDGLLHFYKDLADINENKICEKFISHTQWLPASSEPYCIRATAPLPARIPSGITVTAPGFYAPQGRDLRLEGRVQNLPQLLNSFRFEGLKITNFEMETSALYGLGKLLGHSCLSLSVVVANRLRGEFSRDLIASEDQVIESGLRHLLNL